MLDQELVPGSPIWKARLLNHYTHGDGFMLLTKELAKLQFYQSWHISHYMYKVIHDTIPIGPLVTHIGYELQFNSCDI